MIQDGLKWILNKTLYNVTFWPARPPIPSPNVTFVTIFFLKASLRLDKVFGLKLQFLNLGHLIDILLYLSTLILKVRVDRKYSSWTRTTDYPMSLISLSTWSIFWSGWVNGSRRSFWDTFTFSTFLPALGPNPFFPFLRDFYSTWGSVGT